MKHINMKYKHLRQWNYELGAQDYYIQDRVEEAIRDNAPADAVYKSGNTWRTFTDIAWNLERKADFESRMMQRYGEK